MKNPATHDCLSCELYIQHFSRACGYCEVYCVDTPEHDVCRYVDMTAGCAAWQGSAVEWIKEVVN